MQKFIIEHKLLSAEEKAFRDRCCTILDWTYDQWCNRWRGKTAITPSDRIAMAQILKDLREEVSSGDLNLVTYNTK